MEKLTWKQLIDKIHKHNEEYNVTRQYGDENRLKCVVVFNDIKSWNKEYPLESKSYRFGSDNKYFIPGMLGNSIFATSIDGTDCNIRLDHYIHEWTVDYCYIEGEAE